MKSRFALLCLFAFATITISLSSCVKIQNKVLMKGTWELVSYKLDTIDRNYMEVILPGYVPSTSSCRYMIDFKDNDVVTGSYYVADTLNYTVDGTWSLDEKSTIVVSLDKYVDGTFEVDRENRKTYYLTTDSNNVEFAPGFFTSYPVKLDIKRRF
jgi:hypothetical protein